VKLIITTILVLFAMSLSVFPQTIEYKDIKKNSCSCDDERVVKNYFENLIEQNKFIEQCLIEAEENQLKSNLPKPKKVSHLNPTAVSLPKPYFPNVARQLRISGEVLVEIITDENGKVIYAKVLKGNGLLVRNVKQAICNSKFIPEKYCGDLVKTKRIIRYNFILNNP
jgi:TonB family protein